MAKKKDRQNERIERRITPKERRYRSRQQERNRRFVLFGAAAVALAGAFILVGVLYTFVYQPNTTAFTVEGQHVTTAEFRKRYHYERTNMENRWRFYRLVESQLGSQPQTQVEINRLTNYLQDAFSLGVFVKTQMVEDILLARVAPTEGVVISEEDVDKALEQEIADRYGKVTMAQATATMEAAAAQLESDANPIPTLEMLTTTDLEQGLEGIGSEIQADFNLTLEEYRAIVKARLLRQAMSRDIGERDVIMIERQINPRHILLGFDAADVDTPTFGRTETDALLLAERLLARLASGESFSYLASLYSDDPSAESNAGDLGWVREGTLVPEFEKVALGLALEELSSPIKTDFGYHIIQVLDVNLEADRPSNEIQAEVTDNFNRWLQTLQSDAQIEERGNLIRQLPAGAEQAAEDFLAS